MTFWENGLHFECQGTGHCCTSRGEYGYVYLTRDDRKRLAEHLELTPPQFVEKHCAVTNDHLHLKNPDQDCAFLKDKRCTVYAARPTQCRTWPFWAENMNAKAWNDDVAVSCAGVGKGRLWSADEINDLVQLGKRSTKR